MERARQLALFIGVLALFTAGLELRAEARRARRHKAVKAVKAVKATKAERLTPETLLRPRGRVEMSARPVYGQSLHRPGGIFLFARQRVELKSMVSERDTYRREVLRTVFID